MNVVTLLITQAKPSLLEQPRERGFHHPADRAEAATVSGVPFGDPRDDATTTQRLADLFFCVVPPVCVHRVRAFARAAAAGAYTAYSGGKRIYEGAKMAAEGEPQGYVRMVTGAISLAAAGRTLHAAGSGLKLSWANTQPPKCQLPVVHKNSLEYVGETHVYRIIGPDGKTYKIGQSSQGVRATDGASIRGAMQARRLSRETGDEYGCQILRTFPDKRSACEYERWLIRRLRSIFGPNALPGNKGDR